MARPSRCLTLGLALVGLLSVNLALEWVNAATGEESVSPSEAFYRKGSQKLAGRPAGYIAGDLYKLLIRDGLVPKLDRARIHIYQNYGDSVFHKLARAWHAVFMYQLRNPRFPDAWKIAAAEVHRKLGGRGDFLKALPVPRKKHREFNLNSGKLREEFLSLALFFLNAFVPKDIERCRDKKDEVAASCISLYHEPLQAALLSTLATFFEYILARCPASRILMTSFIFAAVLPCPFGYMIEPVFVYGAMVNSPLDLLKSLSSIKHMVSAKACPDFKKALLRMLIAAGVTPGDMMRARNLEKEFSKFPDSAKKAVKAEAEAVNDAGSIDVENLLKKDGAPAGPALDTAGDMMAELGAYTATVPTMGREDFFASRIGQRAKQYIDLGSSKAGRGYADRVKLLLEDDGLASFGPLALMMEDVLEEVTNAFEAEAKANPRNIPFKPANSDSLEQQAKQVIDQTRGFNLQTEKFLQPKQEN